MTRAVHGFGLAWAALAAAAVGGLLAMSLGHGGSHWPFFGAPLDAAMLRLGLWVVVLAAGPCLVAGLLARRPAPLVASALLAPAAAWLSAVATD